VRLRVFHADDGDCLLLTSADGHHLLVDGGRSGTFRDHAWPTLEQMAEDEEEIDLVVVSHVDADHITGIAWLFELVVEWIAHDFQRDTGNGAHKPPKLRRPPVMGGLWHNSWLDPRDPVGGQAEALVQRVDALAAGLTDTPDDALVGPLRNLALGLEAGADLRRLVDEGTSIPRNRPFRAEVLRQKRRPHVEALGSTSLTVLGPTRKHLDELEEEWEDILAKAGVTPGDVDQAAHDIVTGGASQVTIENRASIMLLAEEVDGDRTASCLLTGDAAQAEIIEGLEATGHLADGPYWCDVVKVQHHGSEHNVDEEFARQVVAGTYVFCGNGGSGNPDPRVVKRIIEARVEDERPFALWFNCSPARTSGTRREALTAAIAEARAGEDRHPGLTVHVLDDEEDFVDIDV
jgi:beta-lactamase superfamily II metal-dependent hydrolase